MEYPVLVADRSLRSRLCSVGIIETQASERSSNHMLSRIKYLVVSASACLTILLVTGSLPSKGADQSDTLKHIGVFSDVVAHIKSEYVEEPDMKSVTLGALNGLLEAIDPSPAT